MAGTAPDTTDWSILGMSETDARAGHQLVLSLERRRITGKAPPSVVGSRMAGKTLFDKIWDRHVIAELGGLRADAPAATSCMTAGRGAERNRSRAGAVRARAYLRHHGSRGQHRARLAPPRDDARNSRRPLDLRARMQARGVPPFDLNQPGQGIIHVIGPSWPQPARHVPGGDSYTCTHGGWGAIASASARAR
jgi:3-isopropylmalate/(R)-2-methylmalate dehydratase large subunit